jgi:hypothetical protein
VAIDRPDEAARQQGQTGGQQDDHNHDKFRIEVRHAKALLIYRIAQILISSIRVDLWISVANLFSFE